jgi:phosphoribosyl 1,2-cyclic phosphodiesterase
VGVIGRKGTMLVLDAGTGIRRLAGAIPANVHRVDILLTHLHMDHIQGLGFFAPLYRPDFEVHIWGPGSATLGLQARLMRYLSPPLFPIHLSELSCKLVIHQLPSGVAQIGEFLVTSTLVCHPGPTIGYRIAESDGGVLAYLPDHEPALGTLTFPQLPRAWTSGAELASGADLLIHDGQYDASEYPGHHGWGHSSLEQTFAFGTFAEVKHLVPFHHDPGHSDDDLDRMTSQALDRVKPAYRVTAGMEGTTIEV